MAFCFLKTLKGHTPWKMNGWNLNITHPIERRKIIFPTAICCGVSMLIFQGVLPRNLTWNLKMMVSKFGISKLPGTSFQVSMLNFRGVFVLIVCLTTPWVPKTLRERCKSCIGWNSNEISGENFSTHETSCPKESLKPSKWQVFWTSIENNQLWTPGFVKFMIPILNFMNVATGLELLMATWHREGPSVAMAKKRTIGYPFQRNHPFIIPLNKISRKESEREPGAFEIQSLYTGWLETGFLKGSMCIYSMKNCIIPNVAWKKNQMEPNNTEVWKWLSSSARKLEIVPLKTNMKNESSPFLVANTSSIGCCFQCRMSFLLVGGITIIGLTEIKGGAGGHVTCPQLSLWRAAVQGRKPPVEELYGTKDPKSHLF